MSEFLVFCVTDCRFPDLPDERPVWCPYLSPPRYGTVYACRAQGCNHQSATAAGLFEQCPYRATAAETEEARPQSQEMSDLFNRLFGGAHDRRN